MENGGSECERARERDEERDGKREGESLGVRRKKLKAIHISSLSPLPLPLPSPLQTKGRVFKEMIKEEDEGNEREEKERGARETEEGEGGNDKQRERSERAERRRVHPSVSQLRKLLYDLLVALAFMHQQVSTNVHTHSYSYSYKHTHTHTLLTESHFFLSFFLINFFYRVTSIQI